MRILLLVEKYPNYKNGYNNDFIHQRAQEYIKKGHEVFVILYSDQDNYLYESVTVYCVKDKKEMLSKISLISPDSIGIHFYKSSYFEIIKTFKGNVVIWVHGHEALNWYRRLYDYKIGKLLIHIPGLLFLLIKRVISWNKLVKLSKRTNKISFVFVSKWMKNIAEIDNLTSFKNFYIIPNSINVSRFKFLIKPEELRLKILSIRPYTSRKYANDITMRTIIELSKRSFFKELEFNLFGDGPQFEMWTKQLQKYENVKIHRQFIANDRIAAEHKKHGVFLCPTRQDAQGVSMCEAMASGLVPITSNNTAIPEFVQNKISGLLNSNNPIDFADSIEYLYYNPDVFIQLSQNASNCIANLCDPDRLAAQELNILIN